VRFEGESWVISGCDRRTQVARIIKILSSNDKTRLAGYFNRKPKILFSNYKTSTCCSACRARCSAFCARQFAGSSNGDPALTHARVSQLACGYIAEVATGAFGFSRLTSYTACRVLRLRTQTPHRVGRLSRCPQTRRSMLDIRDRGFFPLFQFSETTH
jgi:hypothetical protein